MNPDGIGVNVYFGNMHSWIVMIDALPIPAPRGDRQFRPATVSTSTKGLPRLSTEAGRTRRRPPHASSTRRIRDPSPSRVTCFGSQGKSIAFLTRDGKEETILTDPPRRFTSRVLRPRPREPVIPSRGLW